MVQVGRLTFEADDTDALQEMMIVHQSNTSSSTMKTSLGSGDVKLLEVPPSGQVKKAVDEAGKFLKVN